MVCNVDDRLGAQQLLLFCSFRVDAVAFLFSYLS